MNRNTRRLRRMGGSAWDVKPPAGTPLDFNSRFAQNIRLSLLFNTGQGATVYDNSPYQNNGTIANASWLQVNGEWMLDFDGTGDKVTIADADSLTFEDNSPMTIMFCFAKDADTGVIARKYSVANNLEYNLGVDGSDKFVCWVYDDDNNAYRGRYTPALTDAVYYHVVVVYDGGTVAGSVKIYVDGVQVDDTDLTGNAFTKMRNLTSPLILGENNGGINGEFDGRISYFHMWASEFSLGDVQELYATPYIMYKR